MRNIGNEVTILNIIKYGPILFVLIVSSLFTYILIGNHKDELKKEVELLEKVYVDENKERVRNLVNKIHSRVTLEKQKKLDDVNKLLKSQVYQAYSVVNSIYKKNKNNDNYSREKTIEEIKTALRDVRFFDDLGYFFIYELTGKNILNAKFPNIEGKNLINHKDSNGISLLKEMQKILSKKDETYYDWYWKKSKNDPKEYKKIGFFKKFEPLGIFIGTGQYFDVVEQKVQKDIADTINKVKFVNPEHIFIYTMDGLCLVNPKKELIGKNRLNIKNAKGEYLLQNVIKFIKKEKEGFKYYSATVKLDEKLKSNSKISYIKLFEDWNWIIGSGFYLEGLNKKIALKEEILTKSTDEAISKIIYTSFGLTLMFIFLSFYLSRQLEIKFNSYKRKLEDEIQKAYEKEKLLIQQSKMATMGEMLGSIAHQWKQPLSLLSLSNGLIKISRENEGIFSAKDVDEAILNIDTAIHNLNQTVEDFRNFFNPNKERALYKVSDAFNETFKLTSSQFKNNNIELVENIGEVELYGSQNELQQVLINLLKNAKEELVKKEATLKRYIFINVWKEENCLKIAIRDNAGGIPENILPKIFEAYFTTKEENGGSGIGLYMCKQIIEGHMHGEIMASNKEFTYDDIDYIGAEFIITIPMDLRKGSR